MASGVSKAIITAEVSPARGKGWLYTSAALSVLLGVLIVSSWPAGSVDLLGFMISLELIFTGSSLISMGTVIKDEEKEDKKIEKDVQKFNKAA